MMTQTWAILVDAYRDMQSRKLFWTVLILNVLAMLAFGLFGANDHALTFLWWEPFGRFLGPVDYKILFSNAVVGIWLTWAATILALISVAGIFPDLMTSGSIDLYLSKPISRLRLFFTKYMSGLLFVALQVTVFSVMSFLVLGVRGGFWEPGLFYAIPLVVLFFSYLFGICVLLGVLTRSTIAALLLTILAWGGIAGLDFVDKQAGRAVAMMALQHESLERQIESLDAQIARTRNEPQTDVSDRSLATLKNRREETLRQRDRMIAPDLLISAQKVAYYAKTFVPKTRETLGLLDRILFNDNDLAQASKINTESAEQAPPSFAPPPGRGGGPGRGPAANVSESLVQAQLDRQRSIWWVVGTSLVFEAVMLALAAWYFCTRDF
jgi:hypothetical protein